MNKEILKNKYKISIVIPVYNTEKYFRRCIKSVLQQSYKNLEIIVVDDGSTGNIRDIIQEYIQQDNRIQFICHLENKGLFQARLTGASKATGQYIAFLDSDDYVSLDYYHTLLKKITSQNADIAIGHTVHCRMDGYKYIYNMHDACLNFEKLEKCEVRQNFFRQKGLCYGWHTIWNKLYSKTLWDYCESHFSKMKGHIVMTEDIAFSSVLFYFASSVTTVENDAYFYCENENASTNASSISMKKFQKNMNDIKEVFNFVELFLKEVHAEEAVIGDFHEFKKYYARLWSNIPKYQLSGLDAVKGREILKAFCPDETGGFTKDDQFFDSIQTPWCGGLEYIKELIIQSQDEYISFDIFDTLISRPFYEPTDLFELMDMEFEKLMISSIKFKKIRMDSEKLVRERYGKKFPRWQDVTIDEIYDQMGRIYDIPAKIIQKLKIKEIELELEFCNSRNAGKELFEVALLSGKKVIIVSDMYLKEDTIKEILKKNGYEDYHKLYLSSEIRLTKNNGSLYGYIKKELGVPGPVHIFHIGDTWQNDYINADKNGFSPIFFPKAKEIFENKIEGICTNYCASLADIVCDNFINIKEMKKTLGIRTMCAIVFNKYFDNPYRTFHPESDLNADPYFIGYYILGMHLTGLAFWIMEECRNKKIDTIHFLARDGYTPMKAYEILSSGHKNLPGTNYVYASRKAVLLGMIRTANDFYNLPVEYKNHSPKTLMKLLEFAVSNASEEPVRRICDDINISYEKPFCCKKDYLLFIHHFIKELYDEDVFNDNFNMAKEYYSIIKPNDITFDMGYSGRIQKAISVLAGRGVDALFVHGDSTLHDKMQRLGNFHITKYYDFTPKVSGLLREHILSDSSAGCVGFCRTEQGVRPILEKREKKWQDIFVVECMHKGALDFICKYNSLFENYFSYIPFRFTEASLPFESYLGNAKKMDRLIFSSSYFEDFVYGANEKINIKSYMYDFNDKQNYKMDEMQEKEVFFQTQLDKKGKITRAVIYFMLDKSVFGAKMANELRDKPLLYRIGKWCWNLTKEK